MTQLLEKEKSAEISPLPEPHIRSEIVTPQTAQIYLETQVNNRKINKVRVAEYAQRMERGEWQISQPLIFSDEGTLIDGQHRLAAVIKSGLAVPFIILTEMPSQSQLYVDIGQSRTKAQIAKLQGIGIEPHGAKKLAITNAMFLGQCLSEKNVTARRNAEKNIVKPQSANSPHMVIDLYVNHKEGIDFSAQHMGNKGAIRVATVRAVIARAYYSENHQRLQEFVDVLDSGYPTSNKDEAALSLRNLYFRMQQEGKATGRSLDKMTMYSKTQTALKHFLAGDNVRTIHFSKKEYFPLPAFD